MPVMKSAGFTLKYIDLSDATQVNSGGGTDTKSLQPPVGKIWEVIGLNLNMPDAVGSTAGTHSLLINMANDTDSKAIIASCVSNTGVTITYAGRYGFTGTTVAPTALDNLRWNFKTHNASNEYPMLFKYINSLDAHQTGTRTIKILVKEFNEGA